MMKNKLFYYLIAIACLGCQHKEGNKEQISYLLKQDTVNKSSVAMVPDESSFEMRLYAEVLPVTEDRVYFTIYNHSDREVVVGDDVKIEYYIRSRIGALFNIRMVMRHWICLLKEIHIILLH